MKRLSLLVTLFVVGDGMLQGLPREPVFQERIKEDRQEDQVEPLGAGARSDAGICVGVALLGVIVVQSFQS